MNTTYIEMVMVLIVDVQNTNLTCPTPGEKPVA